MIVHKQKRCKKRMKVKRSRSLSPKPSSSVEDMKHLKLQERGNINERIPHPYVVLYFSDEVLLNIFKYLSPQDLMTISLSCQRFRQLAKDKTLWRRVDFRRTPILLDELKKYIKFLQPVTTHLAIRGNLYSERDAGLSACFIYSIKAICTQLKELIIEEYYINGDEIRITDFPRTIEKLSLEGCKVGYLHRNKSYFRQISFYIPNLTSLILSNCQWVTSHSLLAISKLSKLKELRLNSCHSLGECVVYTSLAAKLGFRTLEILDLRDTALGDSEVGCFNCTKTLTHLYLECPANLRNAESAEREPQSLQEALHPPVYEDANVAQFVVEDRHQLVFQHSHEFQHCLITDRAICSLGICDRRIINNSAEGIIIVEEDKRIFNNPHLKTLVVRNYPYVTNSSLVHLALNVSSLEYLDVTGTSVTRQGVETFKSQKANVKIVSSFDET